ncbi:MAG: F0F1 ATP synthase subunit epsilon [Gaiellales bacterium]|nr:MAG: F0F1 ATP synthase subunit epsilon [Gaiellales bacterium]
MRLKVLVPDRVLIDQEVSRVVAWGHDGSFCLLPRHIDFVSALAPGLLTFEVDDEYAEYLAVDEGILVKHGPEVLVASRKAVSESELEALKQALEKKIRALDEMELETRTVVARLEADFARSCMGGGGDD